MRPLPAAAAILLLASSLPAGLAQQTPTPAAANWWRLTSELSNDSMEGRDTGTAAYERAAKIVAGHLAAAGLKPAGDNGTFFQRVPMHEVDLDTVNSSVELLPGDTVSEHSASAAIHLDLLQQVTLLPRADLPPLTEAPMVFIGYGLPDPAVDLHGRIAVFFNNSPADLDAAARDNFATRRARALLTSGAAATVSIDNPGAIEPFHWPAAYAHSVTLAAPAPPVPLQPLAPIVPNLRISSEAAAALFRSSGHQFADILRDGIAGSPLPTFPLHARLRLQLHTTSKEISSPNILAILPGTAAPSGKDANATPELVALSAHLDGYGFGTPVDGDSLYNGALDDAAYVATLLQLADTVAHAPASQRPHRSLLFCIFTGEEKGLLGSAWFTQHPTAAVPHLKEQVVADLNLDQLRAIFPLRILTMEGIADSTLGDTARTVAGKYSIELRPDREPERSLFRRSDNFNFVRIGVPIASFIFGYNPGSPEERTYRDWYARRYHKPQDDLLTPIDWDAAATFNNFFRDLALAVADAPSRPQWSPSSPYAPANRNTAPQP